MKIIRIDKNDLNLIRPLWEKLNRHHESVSTHFKGHFKSFTFEERCKEFIKKKNIAFFLAKNENGISTGYSIAFIENQSGEIDSIYIDNEYRNLNIGSRLISTAEKWLLSIAIIKNMFRKQRTSIEY